MRKRILAGTAPGRPPNTEQDWLDLDRLAEVEITSEDACCPIESALTPGTGGGWRAEQPGEQTIRILFTAPQTIRLIHVAFHEDARERTQEFVLSWSPDGGRSYREILRQQYHFSPPGTTREIEDYLVDLDNATALELRIVPEIGGGAARATLARLAIA